MIVTSLLHRVQKYILECSVWKFSTLCSFTLRVSMATVSNRQGWIKVTSSWTCRLSLKCSARSGVSLQTFTFCSAATAIDLHSCLLATLTFYCIRVLARSSLAHGMRKYKHYINQRCPCTNSSSPSKSFMDSSPPLPQASSLLWFPTQSKDPLCCHLDKIRFS